MPPLVGYAAATGALGLPALWLFLIVFLWTPPHFWALALLIKENYAAAKVPMLPVVRGEAETTRQIVLYSVGMVAFTLAVGLSLGPLYSAVAAVLGASSSSSPGSSAGSRRAVTRASSSTPSSTWPCSSSRGVDPVIL